MIDQLWAIIIGVERSRLLVKNRSMIDLIDYIDYLQPIVPGLNGSTGLLRPEGTQSSLSNLFFTIVIVDEDSNEWYSRGQIDVHFFQWLSSSLRGTKKYWRRRSCPFRSRHPSIRLNDLSMCLVQKWNSEISPRCVFSYFPSSDLLHEQKCQTLRILYCLMYILLYQKENDKKNLSPDHERQHVLVSVL